MSTWYQRFWSELCLFFRDISTTAAGDYCSIKACTHALMVSYIIGGAWALHRLEKAVPLDYIAYATGGSVIIGAGAGGAKLKDSTEIQPPPPGNPDQEKS